MCKVSVIVPVYNVEKYIEACLESVLGQTLESFEVICIDDVSTDRSMETVNRYAETDSRIKIVRHSFNRGLSAARNTGLDHAAGEYIFFLDSDDLILPETLEELFLCAEENGLDEIYFNMKKIYEAEIKELATEEKVYYYDSVVHTGQEMFRLFSKNSDVKVGVWRQFYRKDFLKNHGIRFYEGILYEDILFSFLCFMNAGRVMNINKEYYIYRQRPGSIMATMNAHRFQSLYIVLLEILKYWNNHEFSTETNDAIAQFFCQMYETASYLKHCFDCKEEIRIGTYAEKYLYQLLMRKKKLLVTLSKEKLEQLHRVKKIVVYGAGRAAVDLIDLLQKEKIHISAVTVSNTEVTAKVFCGFKVQNISDFLEEKSDITVVIGLTKKYSDEVKGSLIGMGFQNLMSADG